MAKKVMHLFNRMHGFTQIFGGYLNEKDTKKIFMNK